MRERRGDEEKEKEIEKGRKRDKVEDEERRVDILRAGEIRIQKINIVKT